MMYAVVRVAVAGFVSAAAAVAAAAAAAVAVAVSKTVVVAGVVAVVAAMAVVEAGFACFSNPCLHGVCVDQLNSSRYSCFCIDGYTGLRCQTNWDECWSSPCLNGATCVDLVAALTCICPPGYTGELCGAEINECQSNPCQNNGTCHDFLNHYVCDCPTGYSGEHCEVDVSVCNSSSMWTGDDPQCYHGGLCVDGPGLSYTCLCQPGWTGRRCENDVNECLYSPCHNVAVCINTPGSFACACQFGFTGTLCQEAVVFCDESPCQNGALCVMEDHNATCYCVPDYHGTHCQDQYNDCLPYAPRCMNGGECIDGVDSFLCSCPSPSTGVLCQCLTTPHGQICQQLPHWFQDKPYQPVGTTEKDIFHHWFNASHVLNESLTDYFPSPTSTDDIYVYPTASVDISDYDVFPTETAPPTIEVVSTISPTLPRDPKDYITPSSVISAKQSPVYSELESSSVPYPSSELFDSIFPSASIFPSTMEWSEFWSMQPSPVLPVVPSSPDIEVFAVLSSEFVTSTSVPDIVSTHVLEGSFPTLSVELVSLSIVSVFDVSTTPFFDSLPALEPTPVLSISSSFLETATSVLVEPPTPVFVEPATSVFVEPAISVLIETATSVFIEPATSILVDTTASSPTYTSDIVTVTFLPDDDGLGNQTFTPEADLASTPPFLLPGDDASTDTTRFTEDFITFVSPTTELPENETSYPTSEEDKVTEPYNATDYITLDSEQPSLTTTSYTPIPTDNFTDAVLRVSTKDTTPTLNTTDEPFTTTYDTVDATREMATTSSSMPPEYEDTGGLTSTTDSALSTTLPGYEDSGGTTPVTDVLRPTDGLSTSFTPDTERQFSSTTFFATTEVYVNITTVSVDEYDEYATSPTPTDEYNATVTVPPDIPTVDAVNVTDNDTLMVTEDGPVVTPEPTSISPVTTYTASPTPSTHLTMYDNITTYITPFNETLFITDGFYNESFTPDFTTFIDSTFTRDYTPTNVSYTTDISVFNESSMTDSTLLDDSFTTELSTYDTSLTSELLYPNESFTTVNISTDIPHVTTIFSYVTEKTTVNDSFTTEQTTPDDYYITLNETSTALMTTPEIKVETSSVSLPTEAPLTDTAWPLTDGLPVTEEGPQTSVVTEVQTEPAGVTTDGKVVEPSITSSPSTTLTTGLVEVFTVVTEPPEDLENVTIPDYEFQYNASVNGFNITSTAISPVATEIPAFPKPEVPLLPTTRDSATEVPPTQTPVGTTEPSVTPLPLFPLTTPTSVTFTTAAPNITFQVPTTLTPTTLVPGLDATTEPDEGDYTASSSVKDPVFETTSQRPREPPKTITDTSVAPTTTSTTPPVTELSVSLTTAVTPTETQSDQPPAVACGTGYCLNGGICVFRDANFSCQCPFNYRGTSCDLYFYINKPYFVGASYLGVHVGNMSLRRGVQVYVQFTSQDPNGLVAYSEGSSDAFFMLLLRNSLLQFVFSCGLQTVSFLQGNEKLSRNYLTDVSVRMWWTPYRHDAPWGPGMCSASMQVNGTAPIYSEQRSSSPWVRLGLLYLGGLPSSYSSPLVVKAGFLPRLKGCVSLLEVNGQEIDMWVSSVAGERVEECGSAPCPAGSCYNGGSCVPGPALWSCRCPPGYHGELCEQAECGGGEGVPCHSGQCIPTHHAHPLCLCPTHRHGLYCELERVVERPSYSGTVEGYSSYSVYRLQYDVTHTIALRLHLTTKALQQVGLLVYLGNEVRSARQDFLALSLVRGHLMLTWDLGAGPRRIMTSEALDATLHTHSALIGRRGRGAWLVVDSQRNVSADSQGYLSSLNTNNMLFIGGHPSWNMSHLPADMWRHQGFRGCVFDLRVASTPEGPWTALRIAGATNVKECGQDECHRDSCNNGGTCVGLGATIRCECPVGWKGPRCEVSSHVCEGGGRCAPGASCLGGGSPGAPATCLCQLGRTGPRCEKVANITDPHFSGDGSYLSLHAKNLRRESEVAMSFRPTRLDGLLLLVLPRRPPGDFMALALVNGTLQFTYHLGWRAPGLVVVRSEGEVRLEEWQTVQVWRRGGDGALTFRGTTARAASPSPTTLLDVHTELFLGGVPDSLVVPSAVAPPESRVPFRGCVRQVTINGVEQDLRVPDGGVVRGAGITDCDGTACGSQVCLNGGTCTPVGDTFICTCLQEYTGARCQLARACLDHLCVNGGTCVPSYTSDGGKKRRHTLLEVEAPPRGDTGDGVSWKREEPVRRGNLIREGGYTMHKEKYTAGKGIVFRERRLILEDGDVASNKKSDDDKEKRIRREGGIFRGVVGKEDIAMGKNEEVRKRETEDEKTTHSRYYCLCPLGYFGVHCEAGTVTVGEVVSARFSGRSFAVVPEGPFGTPAPDTDSLALNFSTSATHGLLLWRGQVDAPGEDFLGVGVSGGRVKVVWHLGGGALGHLTTSGGVRDGAWHSLVVSRTGAVVTVFLNGRPTKAAASGTYTQINDAQGLFVGGFPNDVSVAYGTEGHFQGAFVGCIRDLIVHQASFPIKFSTLQQGQDLQPCS